MTGEGTPSTDSQSVRPRIGRCRDWVRCWYARFQACSANKMSTNETSTNPGGWRDVRFRFRLSLLRKFRWPTAMENRSRDRDVLEFLPVLDASQ